MTTYRDLSGNNLFGVQLDTIPQMRPITMIAVTQAEYNAISNKDPSVLYMIKA